MIIVTVEIPIMDTCYDFQIDEDIPVRFVRDEIMDLVCRRNQCGSEGNKESAMIWDKRRRTIVGLDRTAYENGLETGSELVLV